jgi:hypothetical protein
MALEHSWEMRLPGGDQQQHDTPRTGCVRFPLPTWKTSRPNAVSGANANPQRGHVDFHGLKPRCRWPPLACPNCFWSVKKSLRCHFVCLKPHFCWVLLNKLEIVALSLYRHLCPSQAKGQGRSRQRCGPTLLTKLTKTKFKNDIKALPIYFKVTK